MADESPVQNLCDETTCPICLEYFREPVMVDCGHNFCQACITQYWGQNGGDASASCCPQCRELCQPGHLKPNRPLASIVEIAKKFRLQMPKEGAGGASGGGCGRHQEPLKLFCQDDQSLICVVCDKAKEHREHRVIPKEEAFEEYKERILSHLEFLKRERERICDSKLSVETEGQDLLKQTELERGKIVQEFKQLRQFLEEEERLLLAKLKEVDDEIKDTRNKRIAQLSEEMSSMENLIKAMEEKQKQPADEFLQDIKSTLQRCNAEECMESEVSLPEFCPIKGEIKKFSKIHPLLKAAISTFKGYLTEDIAVPTLVLSAAACEFQPPHWNSYNSYGYGCSTGRLSKQYCWSNTMGTERINSGRRSWVVDVGQRRYWTVGVAKEDIRELKQIQLSPEKGIWAVGKLSQNNNIFSANDDTYCVFTSPGIPQGQYWIPANFTLSSLSVSPTRIRVSLDYEEGSVTFSDADTHDILYTFRDATFAGAELCSWLSVGLMLTHQCSFPH